MLPRVLVAGHEREPGSFLAEELANPPYGIQIDACGHPEEALLKLASGDYVAIVGTLEGEGDLDEIGQLRKASPDLPILLVSSVIDPDFTRRALLAGATAIVPSVRDIAAIADFLVHGIGMNRAATILEARATTAVKLTRDIHGLIREQRAISGSNSYLVGVSRKSRLRPLFVGSDREDASRVLRAFEEADVFSPCPLVGSADEAIAYLKGSAPFTDRHRYPLPNIVLIDLDQPRTSGLELLGWLRNQSQFARTPVVVLSDGIESDVLKQAHGLHANSYLVKPASFGDLVEMAKAIDLYWSKINFGQELL